MPKIIKASIWEEVPCIVEAPPPPVVQAEEPSPAPEEESAALSAENDFLARQQELENTLRQGLEDLEQQKAAFEAMRKTELTKIQQELENADESLRSAKSESDRMRADATQDSERLLHDAREEADSLREAAKQSGHMEGLVSGREEGIAQIREEQRQILLDANAKAERTLADAKEAAKQYTVQAENEIATIALEIVEKILPQHFIDVPQIILPLVRKALMKVKDQPEVVVCVSPDDYDLVMIARAEFQNALDGNATLEVRSDESLHPGDCVLATPNGNVDARLATQLEIVRQAIQDVMA